MTAQMKYEKLSKSGKYAIFSGLRTKIRIATTNFVDEKPLPTFTVEGEFAGPRAKLTPEQRKEARKNAPKLTLAEKVALEEKRLEKMKAKLAAQAAQPQGEAQPVGSF